MAARLAREPEPGMAKVGGRIVAACFDAIRASGSLVFVHASGPFDVAIVGRYAETRIDSSQPLTPAANDNALWTFCSRRPRIFGSMAREAVRFRRLLSV